MTEIESIAKRYVILRVSIRKPIYTSFMGRRMWQWGLTYCKETGYLIILLPESMADAVCLDIQIHKIFRRCAQTAYRELKMCDVQQKARGILDEALKQGKTYLPEEEAVKVLEAYKVPVLKSGLAESADKNGKTLRMSWVTLR
jgi:acyl-CoA synthetase (NDP forming)